MNALLCHDRPDRLTACLDSLREDYWAHLDGGDAECWRILTQRRGTFLYTPAAEGAAHALNRLLRLRDKREDFCRIDSDTIFVEGQPSDLKRASFDIVAPARAGRDDAGPAMVVASGVTYIRRHVIDALGGWNSYGPYGCEDLDYLARARAAGFTIGYEPSVIVETPPESNKRGRRREQLETCLKEFKRRKQAYERGDDLYRDWMR